MDDAKLKPAKETFAAFCRAMDNNDWKYQADEENLLIKSGFQGDGLRMDFRIIVDANRQIVSYFCPLPFTVPEDKRVDVAVAVNVANYQMVHGHFDFNFADGTMYFRLPQSFMASRLGEEAFRYLLFVGCKTVDDYADKFLMLSKGYIDIGKFIEMEQGE